MLRRYNLYLHNIYYRALFTDFHITSSENVPEQVSDYIRFFNEERPVYTLGYLTPKQYRERFSPKQEYAAQTTAGDV